MVRAPFPFVVSALACRRALPTALAALAAPAFPPATGLVVPRGALPDPLKVLEALLMSLLVMEVLVATLSRPFAAVLPYLLETLRLACFDHPMTKVGYLLLLHQNTQLFNGIPAKGEEIVED